MKRTWAVLLTLLLLTAPPVVQAQSGSGDGFDYSINANTITITSYTGDGGAVTIPTNINNLLVTGIGDFAFSGLAGLTSVTIPSSVTSIGQGAFDDCVDLTAITVDAGNPLYSTVDGVLFNQNSTVILAYPSSKIGTSYIIPTSVTIIASYAFQYCDNLTSITLPGSVTDMGFQVFGDCASLKSVYIEGNALSGYFNPLLNDTGVTVYYLAGTSGGSSTFANGFTNVPTSELTAINIAAIPTNGVIPLTVNFDAAVVDNAGHPVTNWNWSFGDGSTSTAQNPSHTYTANDFLHYGAFSISLVETNNIGTPIAGAGMSIKSTNEPVYAGLVLNGGFETGDFTGWTLSGDTSGTLVDDGSFGIIPHSGNYGAVLATSGGLGYLSQTLSTTPGTTYLLSFWCNNLYAYPGELFLVSWNGNTLFETTNFDATNWTEMQFVVSATGPNALLQFGFEDDYDYLGLDDIRVVATQPGIFSLSVSDANLVISGIDGAIGGTYYVLMSTNLALPLSQWTPVATNVLGSSGNFAITVTNAISGNVAQQFYILKSQ